MAAEPFTTPPHTMSGIEALETLSKIGAMREFAEAHRPTHPWRGSPGPVRTTQLSRRLASAPYTPPAVPKTTTTPPPLTASTSPPPVAQLPAVPPVPMVPMLQAMLQGASPPQAPVPAALPTVLPDLASPQFSQIPHAILVAYQTAELNRTAQVALLDSWLTESRQVNERFVATASTIHKEIEELKTLARSICAKLDHEGAVPAWCATAADDEGGETLCWASDDDEASAAESAVEDEDHGSPASVRSRTSAGSSSAATASGRPRPSESETQGSDSDSSA